MWWRWRESNSRPPKHPGKHLQAQSPEESRHLHNPVTRGVDAIAVQSFATAYRPRTLQQSPAMAPTPMTGTLNGSASLLYLGSECVIIVDACRLLPLFNEVRRPRPASSLSIMTSKPVTPTWATPTVSKISRPPWSEHAVYTLEQCRACECELACSD